MAKKQNALPKPDDTQLAEAVRASAQQIWQAGLGAFAKAQQEGSEVFAKLVKDGTQLQKHTQKRGERKVSGVADTVTKAAGSVSKHASGSWNKLEQVFEDRVAQSLASLGVPTRREIQELAGLIEELKRAVAALESKTATAAKKPAAKTSAKNTTQTRKPATAATSKQPASRKTAVKAGTRAA